MRAPTNLNRNVLWVVIARFGVQGMMMIFTVVLARRLGGAGFGEYAFIAAVIFLGNSLTTFGTDMSLIREIASRDDLSKLPAALVIQLALSVFFIILVIVASPWLPNQSAEAKLSLKIYSFALLPLAFSGIFTIILRGKQRMDAYMLLNLSVSLLQIAIVWLFLRPGSNLVTLTKLLVVSQVGGAILGGIICTQLIPGLWKVWHFSLPDILKLARLSAPIALIALVGIFYQKISIYIVSALDGPFVTGWFSTAWRVLEASKIFHLAVFTALYPAMAQASYPARKGISTVRRFWSGFSAKSLNLLLAVSGLISLAVFLLAKPLISLLYGQDFAPAVPALRILIWILIPFTINTFYSLSILAQGNEQLIMRVQLAGLVILAGLNAWWIPKWNLRGACLASILAEILQAVIYLVVRIRLQSKARLWITVANRFRTGD